MDEKEAMVIIFWRDNTPIANGRMWWIEEHGR